MTKKKQFCPRSHDTFQFGRDASKKCLKCRAEDAAAKVAIQEQAIAEADAALERRQAEAVRRREREYQAAIKRGGYDAAMARCDKAYSETNDAYGGRYGLCQWEDVIDGQSLGRMCYRRTADVYCHVHDRQLERETERRRKAKEREQEPRKAQKPRRPARPPAAPGHHWKVCIVCNARFEVPSNAGKTPSRCPEHRSGWDAKPKERDLAYADPIYKRNRTILLKDHPPCSLRFPGCTGVSDTIDHIVAPRLGGTNEMGNLRPACRRCNEARGRAEGNATKQRRAAQRKERSERRNR